MNTTVRIKASQIYKDWHVIDAAGRPLGRVASEAAVLIRGKHKPTYEPHLDDGDFVIIVNASKVVVTGRKAMQIKYHSHSGYPGGLKTRAYLEQLERYPERIIESSVYGMLPKGSLGEAMRKHLKVYRGPTHPHQSQIIGSEKAQAARKSAVEASIGEPMKAPRLRPLSVPTLPRTFSPAVAAAAVEAAVAAPARRTRAGSRPEAAAQAPTPTPDEAEALAETGAAIEESMPIEPTATAEE